MYGSAESKRADGGPTTSHLAVTLLCDRRRLDIALPVAVPVAHLLPALVRLARPVDAPGMDQWELAPFGRPALAASDTLERANILTGEMLLLRTVGERAAVPAASLRDHLEQVVQSVDRAWTSRTSARFLHWTAAVLGAALLAPAARLAGGPVIALQLTVALVMAAAAVTAGRGEKYAAATCLSVACLWAAVAGATASTAAGPAGALVAAAVAGLLPAVVALLGYPGALVHCTAVGVAATGAAAAAVAIWAGAPPDDVAVAMAVIAVLLIGVLPRAAMAATGLSAAAGAQPRMGRFERADRMLTGSLIGVSLLAVIAAVPAAMAGPIGQRLFAVGVGLALLLRSRVFSQIPHLLAERIAGLAVLGVAGIGWYLADPGVRVPLLLMPVLLVVAAAAIAGWPPTGSAVTRARAARVLDLLEQVLVAALIVFASGLLGLFDWMSAAIG